MPLLYLAVGSSEWPLKQPFVISRQTISTVSTIDVTLTDAAGRCGRGAAVGLDYAGETVETMRSRIEAARSIVESGISRRDLLEILPAGGARCAVDAALWDLETRRGHGDPFARAGVSASDVRSAITLGIQSPAAVEQAARRSAAQWLKVKVGGDDPLAIVAAARRGAPSARLIVDPNQAWTVPQLVELSPTLADIGVDLLEQPIPVGSEAELDGVSLPIPLCADEACDGVQDLARLRGRFAAINIKLDKVGGLTAALDLADAAQAEGFRLMVGCMLAPSLAIAPAMVLAQRCAYVDLDAPPFLLRDNPHGFRFEGGLVRTPHVAKLWG